MSANTVRLSVVFLVLIIFPYMLNAADDSEAVATQMAGLATEGQRLLGAECPSQH